MPPTPLDPQARAEFEDAVVALAVSLDGPRPVDHANLELLEVVCAAGLGCTLAELLARQLDD